MARFSRRQIGRARSQRRTNWLAAAGIATNNAISAGTTEHIELMDAADGTQELSKYVDGTLTRIRGQIIVDPDFSASNTASESAHVFLALYVSQVALDDPVVGSGVDQGGTWASDRIIWTGAIGYSQGRAIIAGTDSELLGEYVMHHPAVEIDVKAQRKLGDDSKIFLMIVNTANASSVGIKIGFMLRFLIKE